MNVDKLEGVAMDAEMDNVKMSDDDKKEEIKGEKGSCKRYRRSKRRRQEV